MAAGRSARDWSSWVTRTTLAGSIGVCAYIVLWGPSHLVALAVPVSLLVVGAHFLCRDHDDASQRGWRLWRSIVRTTMCATAVLASVGMVAALSSALGLLVVLALVATTPPVRTLLLHVRDAVEPVTPVTPATPLPRRPARSATMRALSDAELCQEWRRTSRELDRTRDTGRRLALVAARQLLLDEVWARHRHELEAWVACGARAHDGTHRFYDVP